MSGIKKWGWWFSKSLVKLKNSRNSAGQAPLAPLVRACPVRRGGSGGSHPN
jgi:hypothetical protein